MNLGWRKPERRAARLQQQRGENWERESRADFEASRWIYWKTVAWVCYRDASRLHDLLRGLSYGDKWHNNSKEYQADEQVREAIKTGKIKAFDQSGKVFEPLADLGRDPKIFFKSDTIKALWPNAGSEKSGLGAISGVTHLAGDDLERFHSWVKNRRKDKNGYPLPDELQLIPLNDLNDWIDPDCVSHMLRDVHGLRGFLASDFLAAMAEGWRPLNKGVADQPSAAASEGSSLGQPLSPCQHAYMR